MELQPERSVSDEIKQPDAGYAWRHVIGVLGSIFVLCFLSFLTWRFAHPAFVLILMPFLGAQIYKITILMHDCCHYSLFADRQTNVAVGTFSGYFIGTDFKSFSKLHWDHHSKFGEEGDPQGPDYLDLDSLSKTQIAWHLIRPLIGYNLFKVLQFGNKTADLSAPRDGRKPQPMRLVKFLVVTLVVQIAIALVATGGLQVLWLALLYPVCAATFALFFSQMRGFVEHVPPPGVSPVHHARTHLPNWFDRLFFYTLNFNYHIEHHKFPSVPSCHLPKVREMLKDRNEYGETSTSVLKTVSRRLAAARSNSASDNRNDAHHQMQ